MTANAIETVILIGVSAFALVLALAAAADLRRRYMFWRTKRHVARQYREWRKDSARLQ